MADAYRYPLTRICLRTGSLTLPLNLLGVFPERGDLVAYDPEKDAEFALRVEGRSVSGLAPFFAAHGLDVNDELSIRPLEDGRYAFTATARPKRPDYTRPDVVGKLLDAVVAMGVPVSEAEIRARHPEVPSGFPLRQALEREPRLELLEGRWRARPVAERPARTAAPAEAPRTPKAPKAEPAARADARDAQQAPPTREASAARAAAPGRPLPSVEDAAERRLRARQQAEEAAAARAEVEAALEAQAAREAEILALVQAEELERHVAAVGPEASGAADASVGADGSGAADAAPFDDGLDDVEAVESDADASRRRARERLARHAEDDTLRAARDRRRSADDGDDAQESFGWDLPTPRGFRFPWQRKAQPKPAAPKSEPVTSDPFRLDRLGEPRPVDRSAAPTPRVTPTPRAGLFPEGAALNSASLPPGDPVKTKKAREAFARLGYRVEGLAQGQLMLHADLGRRQERVLVHVLPDGQRLDWAALLARRRESGAQQLAVVGDHRDLHRLVSPADLAKATLWSWAGLERALALAADLPIGPFDLEPHFERDGLFEYGLERFERSVARRVQERGTFSLVLERLATLKAPSVFVLDDVIGGGEVPRDQALRVLERLGEAPLHLVSRVDSGEFCLRYRVHEALDGLATYATSLRARLPERQRARVRGTVDPIGADELDPAALAAAAEPIATETAATAPVVPAASAANAAASAAKTAASAARAASPAPTEPAAATTRASAGEPNATAPAAPAERELVPVPVRAAAKGARAQQPLPFAGPGLGAGDDEDDDGVDVSAMAERRDRGRRG